MDKKLRTILEIDLLLLAAIVIGCIIKLCIEGNLDFDEFGSSWIWILLLAVIGIWYYLVETKKIGMHNTMELLERKICQQLEQQGYRHEKKDGTLYVEKNDNTFRIHMWNTANYKIKRLYFVYDFCDENQGKVNKDGWNRAANSININNPHATFLAFEDHFCCRYETSISNARDFLKEFEVAYDVIGGAVSDYNKIYPYLERDYPNTLPDGKSIGFK